jgi:hypothetical protein
MSIQLLITILFVVAIAMFVVDFARGKSLVSLGLALLTGALLLISM